MDPQTPPMLLVVNGTASAEDAQNCAWCGDGCSARVHLEQIARWNGRGRTWSHFRAAWVQSPGVNVRLVCMDVSLGREPSRTDSCFSPSTAGLSLRSTPV